MSEPLLVVRDVHKYFGSVRANEGVSFSVRKGELHALIGENGAGKSTLINILYGITQADKGVIQWFGKDVEIKDPAFARRLGIGVVFQKFSLFNPLTVIENIALAINRPKHILLSELHQLCDRYGLTINPFRQVSSLSAGEKQQIEIIRCLLQNPTLLIMDEPTSVLTHLEVKKLFVLLRVLADEGCAVIFVSHKLNEVEELCQHVTVLRRGKTVATRPMGDMKRQDLIHLMIGDEEHEPHPEEDKGAVKDHKVVLELKSLHKQEDNNTINIDRLCLKQSFITGIAGIAGNGQELLLKCINGECLNLFYTVEFDGKPIGDWDVEDRLKVGILSVPTDRYHTGSIGELSLAANTLLGCMNKEKLAPRGILNFKRMHAFADEIITRFSVATPSAKNLAKALSGGNLQKYIIGRAMQQGPRVLVIANPTWGVDVQSALSIRRRLRQLASQKVAILVISEDLDELFEISDEITVISNGILSEPMPVNDSLTHLEVGEKMTVS